MAQRQVTMHCECGHSKTWTHECPSVIVPIPAGGRPIPAGAVDMPSDPPKEPGAASPKKGGIR